MRKSPNLISPLALRKIRGQLGLQNIITTPNSIPTPRIPAPNFLNPQGLFKGWTLPRLTLFEIIIVGFGIWLIWELYNRYSKNKKKRDEAKRFGASQSKDVSKIASDYLNDRHEYYPDNLEYMYDGSQRNGLQHNLEEFNSQGEFEQMSGIEEWDFANQQIPMN